MLRRMSKRRAFTLIELLVVLVILALLAGLVLPKFLGRTDDAKVSKAKAQIGSFRSALNLYMLDNTEAPTTQQGLDALIAAPTTQPIPKNWKRPYLDMPSVPLDPWDNPYIYESPGPNGEDFVIISLGKDGKEGGSENDADISNIDAGEQPQ